MKGPYIDSQNATCARRVRLEKSGHEPHAAGAEDVSKDMEALVAVLGGSILVSRSECVGPSHRTSDFFMFSMVTMVSPFVAQTPRWRSDSARGRCPGVWFGL